MYNSPRSASIVTNTPGRLFALDRSIFSHILKVAALRKQIIIKQAIDKVEILKFIPPDQKYTNSYLGITSLICSNKKIFVMDNTL